MESYDGGTLKFRLSEQESNQYQQQEDQNLMDFNSKEREQQKISQEIQSENNDDEKTRISSFTEEKLEASKESKEKLAIKPTLPRGYTPPQKPKQQNSDNNTIAVALVADNKNAKKNNDEKNNLTERIQVTTTDKAIKEVIPTDKDKTVITRKDSSNTGEKSKL